MVRLESMLLADALDRAWDEHARYAKRDDGYLRNRHSLIMHARL